SVRVLVVLVDADSVEADLVRVLQLVEIVVVRLVADSRIEQLRRRQVHPHAVVTLAEIVGQVRIRHQVKEAKLHCASATSFRATSESRAAPAASQGPCRNRSTTASVWSSASTVSMWPAAGMISREAFGSSATKSSA